MPEPRTSAHQFDGQPHWRRRRGACQSLQQQLPSAAQHKPRSPLQVIRGANKGKAEPQAHGRGPALVITVQAAPPRDTPSAADQKAPADPTEKRSRMCQSGKWGQRSLPRPVASHTRLKFHRNLLNKSTLFATAVNPWDILHYYHAREGGNRPLCLAHAWGPPTLAARATPCKHQSGRAGPGWLPQHQPQDLAPSAPEAPAPRPKQVPARPRARLRGGSSEREPAPAPAACCAHAADGEAERGPPWNAHWFTTCYSCWLILSPSPRQRC